MRMPSLLFAVIAAFLLGGCSTNGQSTTQIASNFINRQSVTNTTKEAYLAKNPQHIAMYVNDQKPLTPYRIIGVAKVYKYNLIGIQREEATMQNMIKKLAASIGGDGVINVNVGHETMEAKVIQFQKILL